MGNEEFTLEARKGANLKKLLDALDENSRTILWHLWRHKHARISELRGLVATVSDYDVLYRLKEVINKNAMELWNRPAVTFEESKCDPLTGEKVLFSWWLIDAQELDLKDPGKEMVDVFEEKDTVTIVAQLPASDGAARENTKPGSVISGFKVQDLKFNNGVLQISLIKERK